jgi:Fe-S cluster assembly protein SufD
MTRMSVTPFSEIVSAVNTSPGPAWLDEVRAAAANRFNLAGLPTTRQEAWRTTPLPNFGSEAFAVEAHATEPSGAKAMVAPFEGPDGVTLVFVDGLHSSALSSPESAWPAGLRIAPISRMLETKAEDLRTSFSGSAKVGALHDLNTAAFRDGASIVVEEGIKVAAEVRVVVIATATDRPLARHIRHVIHLKRGASLRMMIAVIGRADAMGFTNQNTTVSLDERSRLDIVRVHESPAGLPHFDAIAATVGPHAVLNDTVLQTGASWTRSEIDIALTGERATADLGGVFVARGTQVSDIHTVVSHAAPGVISRQNFRGLAADDARGIFHGQIKVEPEARGADATQSNKNMLLSRRAQVHSTPALEILTDDVKCKHGSATGQIDQAQLFYLRSRGIDLQAATRMLTRAFAGEILSRVAATNTRALVESQVAPSLERLGEAA